MTSFCGFLYLDENIRFLFSVSCLVLEVLKAVAAILSKGLDLLIALFTAHAIVSLNALGAILLKC